ncbi:MAG: hypothetical protein HC789_21325 [Microcoleus sp. CSU_2_2]|nr:hypothetical protein [Microcoleus sp. SU_5_3]NJS12729.1 hypothetical protein [Microcoleus sp. CSU_2_2]
MNCQETCGESCIQQYVNSNLFSVGAFFLLPRMNPGALDQIIPNPGGAKRRVFIPVINCMVRRSFNIGLSVKIIRGDAPYETADYKGGK